MKKLLAGALVASLAIGCTGSSTSPQKSPPISKDDYKKKMDEVRAKYGEPKAEEKKPADTSEQKKEEPKPVEKKAEEKKDEPKKDK